jgi:Tol biopolymer transport system component
MENSQEHLYRIDVDTASGKPSGVPVRVTKDGPTNTSPVVSPDGQRVAFITGNARGTNQRSIAVIGPDGKGLRIIRDSPTGWLLSWRSATELLLAQSKPLPGSRRLEWSFETVNVTSGDMSPVPGVVTQGGEPQYARATDELFSFSSDGASLQITPLSGATSRSITMPKDWLDFTVAPNGRLVAYSTADYGPDGKKKPVPGESRLMNLANGKDELLVKYADSDDASHSTVEFSPDGRYLICEDPAGQRFIIDVQNTGNRWPLYNGQPATARFVGEPSWSPDGRFIIVTGTLPRRSLRLFDKVTADAVSRIASSKK